MDVALRNLHWERVGARHDAALGVAPPVKPSVGGAEVVAPERLRDMLARGEPVAVLDVRKLEDLLARAADRIAGSAWRAPEAVADWAGDLPHDRPVVAYCVYGFQISGDTVSELRRRGLDARILSGGIAAAWHAMGGRTIPLPPQTNRGDAS